MLLLGATIALMIWVAGRIYKAGVLLYWQKPDIRQMWRAISEAQSGVVGALPDKRGVGGGN